MFVSKTKPSPWDPSIHTLTKKYFTGKSSHWSHQSQRRSLIDGAKISGDGHFRHVSLTFHMFLFLLGGSLDVDFCTWKDFIQTCTKEMYLYTQGIQRNSFRFLGSWPTWYALCPVMPSSLMAGCFFLDNSENHMCHGQKSLYTILELF